jgi:hypothetical protein
MRLECVKTEHTEQARQMLDAMAQMMGGDSPDVMKVMMHRSEFFGAHFTQLTQACLRGESEWTVGERELFAGFVSACNQCPF